ncbi:virulence protein RhuM/Fic/DOC family protein [Halomonas sabkhae]|uniref:virulence protein RhuM/Fic/DOC family protein n=1 Tax=Halomonas sabkhae TaxID=626223 RepID=UPI0025B5A370|nr:virulence protein RhuM/Fic/DOC family protein [Halomonas sabkhae]MDN3523945.1 virulence protein RhuM/Fic/DOC family protein [Halomonas sabkhae]
MQQIQIFQSSDGTVSLEVSLQQETVWLSLDQMVALFERDKSVISRHIRNVFREGELERQAVVAKFATTASDGKVYQVDYFNLDVIISVGYRIKSQRGVQFRKWATSVLRQHLVEGYTLNHQRLEERGVELEQAMALLTRTLANQGLVAPEGEAVLRVIEDYARSWSLIQGYDDQSLTEVAGRQSDMCPLSLEAAIEGIAALKRELMVKGEATELFGRSRGDGLASALATIEQGFGDELFYPNVASRAAHLLYLVVKNHPFADGNKRTGSFLFLWYLRLNQPLLARPVEQLVNDNTLVALALLVAESLPEQKALMIRLIEHFVLLK